MLLMGKAKYKVGIYTERVGSELRDNANAGGEGGERDRRTSRVRRSED